MSKVFILLFIALGIQFSDAQKINILTSGNKTSFRGLSVVNNNIIWASGSNGTVAKSTNGGINWQWIKVAGFEKNDFRDIEAFDSNTAIIMSIASPAYILKTTDGGTNWETVFTDTTKEMFLDAMYFKDNKNGVVVGDPVNYKTFIATTNNGGNTWTKQDSTPILANGEAFFASSGSNIFTQKNNAYFVSGGKKSRLYINNNAIEIPMVEGLESTGANSINFYKNNAIIVGGDFTKDTITSQHCALFNAKNKKISLPKRPPTGYRSCVTFIKKKIAITCGLSGVDISYDAGINWKNISKESFNTVAKAKKGNSVFFAGNKGKIGFLITEK